MLFLKLFLVIVSSSFVVIWAGHFQDKVIDGKTVKILRYGQCPRMDHLPLKEFYQIGKTTVRVIYMNNVTALAKEDLKDKLKLTISINRCSSRENLDTCENYLKFGNLDFCQSISAGDSITGAMNLLIIPYQPKMRCPIKKGVYTALNFTFNITPFVMFNVDGWYWRVRVEYNSPKEHNRLIGCTEAEGYTKL